MSKTWFPGGWTLTSNFRDLVFIKPHEREEGCRIEDTSLYQIIIPYHSIPSLVEYLRKEGFIRPEMTALGREEDLKIIHRLLDVVERRR